MPLIINGKPLHCCPDKIADFFKEYPHFKASADAVKSQPIKEVPAKGLLYVLQREFAGVTIDNDDIHTLGSEDATTCHIVVLRHTGSGATCLAHFDGSGTRQGLRDVILVVKDLSVGVQNGRFELHIVGGFKDNKCMSEELSLDLIAIFNEQKEDIHLITACMTDLNDEYREKIHWPVCYGLAVSLKTGEIYRAQFPYKGPDLALRSARHFTGGYEMLNIYDNRSRQLVIGPFSYSRFHNVDRWLAKSDDFIRQRLSTSPEQEPAGFVDGVRAALTQLRDYPSPLESVFKGRPRTYKKDYDGKWIGTTDVETHDIVNHVSSTTHL